MAGAAGPQLQIHGERFTGQDVRTQNTTAVLAVANILKTSLGPVGLDKVSYHISLDSRLNPKRKYLYSIFGHRFISSWSTDPFMPFHT